MTALTVLTADIVDEVDLIGWMTSLAICSLAFASNNVNLVNLVRGQSSQSCQHCQCRQRVAAARRLRSPALQDTLEKGVRATLPIDVRLRLVSAIWDTLPQDADLSPSVLQQAELDRRLSEHRKDPGLAISHEEIMRRVKIRR